MPVIIFLNVKIGNKKSVFFMCASKVEKIILRFLKIFD